MVLPHLDAAYNLARWLTRNDADAEDVVQDAFVRALRYFAGFRGDDARAWLLAIVRNTSYDFLRGDSPYKQRLMTDEGRLMRVRVVRRNVRVAADRASDMMRRVLARGIRLIRNPLNSPRHGVGLDRTLPAAR